MNYDGQGAMSLTAPGKAHVRGVGARACWAICGALLLPLSACSTNNYEAYSLLLDIVRNERAGYAAAAVEALSIYSDNPERREQIHAASSLRNDPEISEAYRKSIDKVR
jgi:hypothetical protein